MDINQLATHEPDDAASAFSHTMARKPGLLGRMSMQDSRTRPGFRPVEPGVHRYPSRRGERGCSGARSWAASHAPSMSNTIHAKVLYRQDLLVPPFSRSNPGALHAVISVYNGALSTAELDIVEVDAIRIPLGITGQLHTKISTINNLAM